MESNSVPAAALTFNAAALNLQPQQPSRVRRAWERVPTKATAAQRKERTVWKRPDVKPFQYQTEHGGSGFAVNGSKRQRMKNMPAFPVKSGRTMQREQEAEATDDELFSRRRKSARRSSINPLRKPLSPSKKPLSPSKKQLITAPRPSRSSVNPNRSPLRNLRVAELSQSPQSGAKRARPSLGGVLGNGTPMRNAFSESAWNTRSPNRALSPAKTAENLVPPQPVESPSRAALFQKQFSPLKQPPPEKLFSFSPQVNFSPKRLFGLSAALPQSAEDSTTQIREEPAASHEMNSSQANASEKHPRRRSARLSGRMSLSSDTFEPPSIESPARAPSPDVRPELPDETASLGVQSNDDHASTQIPELSAPILEINSDTGLAVSEQSGNIDIVNTILPVEESLAQGAGLINGEEVQSPPDYTADKIINETVVDKVEVKAQDEFNNKVDDSHSPQTLGITSPQSSSPSDDQAVTADTQEDSNGSTFSEQSEQSEQTQDDGNGADQESEDELTARLDHWIDPSTGSRALQAENESARNRNAPRFSDDTTILKDFLSRAQAKRAAQALAAPSDSPVRTSPRRTSPRRSPRRALESVDGNSPSPTKASRKPRNGTPPSKTPTLMAFDADESDELASPVKKTTRRSTRAKVPAAGGSRSGSVSMIPLRRLDGTEPPRLRKTPAQELAIVTRSNTRRNKGTARMPPAVLHDLSQRDLSPVKERQGAVQGRKAVDWDAELVSYLGEASTELKRATKAAAASAGKRQASTPAPARTRTALRTESGSGATPARPKVRRP